MPWLEVSARSLAAETAFYNNVTYIQRNKRMIQPLKNKICSLYVLYVDFWMFFCYLF